MLAQPLEPDAISTGDDDAPGPGGLTYVKTSADSKDPSCMYLGE